MNSRRLILKLMLLAVILSPAPLWCDAQDPFDPFDLGVSSTDSTVDDKDKSATDLILEANYLLGDERPLDARTKLLKALEKDPSQYRAHVLLASYYAVHVGHSRLALRYIDQALTLFTKQNGSPPYTDPLKRQEHAHMLYLLSQAKLDLDDYEGALKVLDDFLGYDYFSSWYAGSRAWVLMKLGRIDEAITVARVGTMAGSEPGRTLNMLGILLSMKGERQASLQVFKDAVRHEMSLGTMGQPATPLNNSGEVYKEMFLEDNAESSFLRATSMPDGCEHILPALNLAMLYMDQSNYSGAKSALDNFEACFAQYPLKNGEEHRALLAVARGRIDLHTGHIDDAIKELESAMEGRQWFGKIGTNEADLKVAVLITLAQTLRSQSNHLMYTRPETWSEWIKNLKERENNNLRAWWYMRKATQILTKDLKDLEDIYIRNTDSMIEYPTFGEVLARLPTSRLGQRIDLERLTDKRPEAVPYYTAYLAENMLGGFRKQAPLQMLDQVINTARTRYDSALKVHATLLKLQNIDIYSDEYPQLIDSVFPVSRADILNYGLRFPVNYDGNSVDFKRELSRSVFFLDNSRRLKYSVLYDQVGDEHVLGFVSAQGIIGNIKVKGKDLKKVVNDLTNAVFEVDL